MKIKEAQKSEKLLVIGLYSDICSSCTDMKPILTKSASRHNDVNFFLVNKSDGNSEDYVIASQLAIDNNLKMLPVIVMQKSGKTVWVSSGRVDELVINAEVVKNKR